MARKTLEERFWEKVDKSGGEDACWGWTSATTSKTRDCGTYRPPRPVFRLDGRNVHAARVAWQLYRGCVIPKGYIACHTCDNPGCVNPTHIFVGTHKSNMIDCVRKGRANSPRPYLSPKFSEEDVARVKALLATGVSVLSVAKKLYVSHERIRRIKIGVTWAHVQPAPPEPAKENF